MCAARPGRVRAPAQQGNIPFPRVQAPGPGRVNTRRAATNPAIAAIMSIVTDSDVIDVTPSDAPQTAIDVDAEVVDSPPPPSHIKKEARRGAPRPATQRCPVNQRANRAHAAAGARAAGARSARGGRGQRKGTCAAPTSAPRRVELNRRQSRAAVVRARGRTGATGGAAAAVAAPRAAAPGQC